MKNEKSTNVSQPPSADESLNDYSFQVNGVECYFWFDDSGDLCGKGPPKVQGTIDAVVNQYRPLFHSEEFDEVIDQAEPIGLEYRPLKKLFALEEFVRIAHQTKNPEEKLN
jgi:hypothetical protein